MLGRGLTLEGVSLRMVPETVARLQEAGSLPVLRAELFVEEMSISGLRFWPLIQRNAVVARRFTILEPRVRLNLSRG